MEDKKKTITSRISAFMEIIREDKTLALGVFLSVLVIIAIVFGDHIAPYDPRVQSIVHRYTPPGAAHWFGTDEFGRDIFSRVILGTRSSITIAVVSIFFASLVGFPLGMVAGYKGGKIDSFITKIIDIMMSFPSLLLGLMIATALGPGLKNIIVAITVALIPRFARVGRAPSIVLRDQTFVEAARSIGASDIRILRRYITPNVIGEILVMATLWMATAIRIEASLSFLGLGVQPPTPSWGTMMKMGVDRILMAPWMAIFPGLAIMISSFAFNLLGDSLRDRYDPKIGK